MDIISIIRQPWPWYVAGPAIGLMVPILLFAGNKAMGVSSSLRHICAACVPSRIPFFEYNWREHIWNLFFVLGIFLGGFLASQVLAHDDQVALSQETISDLQALGLTNFKGYIPSEIFNWDNLFGSRGLVFIILGGFMVGFGTRYAGGCTSGHSIMGLSNLQLPSLVATISFFVGGLLVTHFLLSYLI